MPVTRPRARSKSDRTVVAYPLPDAVAAQAWHQARELWSFTEVIQHPEMLAADLPRRRAVAQACMAMSVYLATAAEALRERPRRQSRTATRTTGRRA